MLKNFLLRVIYAVICLAILWLIVPLFLTVVGFTPGAAVVQLVKLCVGCLAVLYVVFGPAPPTPW